MGLKAVDNASDLVAMMAENLTDERRFPKRYRFVFSQAVRDSALAVNRFAHMANALYPKDRLLATERLRLIDSARAECENLLSLLEVASRHGKDGTSLLEIEPMRDFVKASCEEKKLLAGWRDSTEKTLNSLPKGGVGEEGLCSSSYPSNSCLAWNANEDGNLNANNARNANGAVPD